MKVETGGKPVYEILRKAIYDNGIEPIWSWSLAVSETVRGCFTLQAGKYCTICVKSQTSTSSLTWYIYPAWIAQAHAEPKNLP